MAYICVYHAQLGLTLAGRCWRALDEMILLQKYAHRESSDRVGAATLHWELVDAIPKERKNSRSGIRGIARVKPAEIAEYNHWSGRISYYSTPTASWPRTTRVPADLDCPCRRTSSKRRLVQMHTDSSRQRPAICDREWMVWMTDFECEGFPWEFQSMGRTDW